MKTYLDKNDVKGILALGQADGRHSICLERVALNWLDARIPDEDGHQPIDQVISPGNRDLWTTLPIRTWVNSNVQISYSAGTYVCNYLYYRCLEWSQKNNRPALFVHIPLLTSQMESGFNGLPKMENDVASRELRRILESLP